MSNKNFDLLKRLDAQLAALDKIVKGGDFFGAGLDVTIEVLRRRPDVDDEDDEDDDDLASPPRLQMMLTENVDALMALLRKDLVARREVIAAVAHGDINELRDFLAGESPAVPSAGAS